jgi:hypothetical protein
LQISTEPEPFEHVTEQGFETMNTSGSVLVLVLAAVLFVCGPFLLLGGVLSYQATLSAKAATNLDTSDNDNSNAGTLIRVIVPSPYGK